MDKKDSVLEQARFAADNSDWQGYTLAGKAVVTRHYQWKIEKA
ncbi:MULTISPECIES: hypothetical protein [Colwellia]|uniref:Uncharacterized protein n=1 Tax=Colwellia psychrerythraea (strain 34H / ATCC BAA-681) TaxID=167879 RepID=Q480Q3_COLP3|nr:MULTISPECIES: hypothetical protein [Colwellia]AAZ24575.1 hypothetical protein CPS_2754 [Colwellia psychrerythraea 34H]